MASVLSATSCNNPLLACKRPLVSRIWLEDLHLSLSVCEECRAALVEGAQAPLVCALAPPAAWPERCLMARIACAPDVEEKSALERVEYEYFYYLPQSERAGRRWPTERGAREDYARERERLKRSYRPRDAQGFERLWWALQARGLEAIKLLKKRAQLESARALVGALRCARLDPDAEHSDWRMLVETRAEHPSSSAVGHALAQLAKALDSAGRKVLK